MTYPYFLPGVRFLPPDTTRTPSRRRKWSCSSRTFLPRGTRPPVDTELASDHLARRPPQPGTDHRSPHRCAVLLARARRGLAAPGAPASSVRRPTPRRRPAFRAAATARRNWLWVALRSTWRVSGPFMILNVTTMRYEHDFFSGFLLLAIFGGWRLLAAPSTPRGPPRAAPAYVGLAVTTIVIGVLLGFGGYFKHFERHNPALLHALQSALSVCRRGLAFRRCERSRRRAKSRRSRPPNVGPARAPPAPPSRRSRPRRAAPCAARTRRPAMMSGARSPTIHDAAGRSRDAARTPRRADPSPACGRRSRPRRGGSRGASSRMTPPAAVRLAGPPPRAPPRARRGSSSPSPPAGWLLAITSPNPARVELPQRRRAPRGRPPPRAARIGLSGRGSAGFGSSALRTPSRSRTISAGCCRRSQPSKSSSPAGEPIS